MPDPYLNQISNVKRDAALYNDPSNQPDTFSSDPLMQGFLTALHGYQSGASDKMPQASDYSGGNTANEKLLQLLLGRLFDNQYVRGESVPQSKGPNLGAATVGEAAGGSPVDKLKSMF